ncbi:hypothetical protein H7271_11295 [Bittarella massiliensis]|uniref:hypothetical protein n=1 Tax=Bittarella massiliensis (ex Durand et al. 2017) TaxID=1720313 RepID=UPI00163CBF70|nr:hypothetical protein [Bittarella massiliensis (ex Durand et al. 2017)]MBC2872173.1 hypothetical protein [Bittarella massiliensis (ex Durand et al. 2017)]
MILFDTMHIETYNYIVHHFLQLEIFEGRETIDNVDDMDIGDQIEGLLPKYLFREQYKNCVKAYRELFYWTTDDFYHQMEAFHELALYQFVDYMADLREDMDNFDELYFDENCHSLIRKSAEADYREDDSISLEEIVEFYYDVFDYPDVLFTDVDFKLISSLCNRRVLGDTFLEDYLGINIDFYFDILPLDIQKKYQTKTITLTGQVSKMLQYVQERIRFGSLYKLFWENGEPVNEDKIQIILENLMDAYFYNQEVDITREALLGTGQVDFKLYRHYCEDEKILIEIKKANNPHLKQGYEKQLTEYMLSSKYKNSFYLIACFTDKEYERAVRFIREHVYTDTVQLYINISILDLRIRKTASLL